MSFLLKKVRLNFVYLAEPKKAEDSDKAFYSCTLMIDKDSEDAKTIQAAYKKTAEENKHMWNGKKPSTTIHDGDEKELDGSYKRPEYCRGKLLVTVKSLSTRRPQFCDMYKRSINDNDEVAKQFYNGVYAAVKLSPFTYKMPARSGISFGLQGVMKIEDAPRIEREAETPEQMFAEIETKPAPIDEDNEFFNVNDSDTLPTW